MLAEQLQEFLEDMNYLDLFQSGFRCSFGTDSVLVALINELNREWDRRSASLLLPNLLSALIPLPMVYLWTGSVGWVSGAFFYCCSTATYKVFPISSIRI